MLLFNVRATDVSLRQEDCRKNVMHVVPDRYMLADALAQYLVLQKWTNWLLVHGSTPGDLAYADAIKRAAARFGATIVDEREYKDNSGGQARRRRHHSAGQAGEQRREFRRRPDYQVIIVADEDQLFGPYMPYRGGADRAARRRHHRAHRDHLEPRPREMGRDPGQQSFREGL